LTRTKSSTCSRSVNDIHKSNKKNSKTHQVFSARAAFSQTSSRRR
jgi:hypothetical protein